MAASLFYIFNIFIFFSASTVVYATNGSSFSVGTVLFSPADITRECWTQENLALLTSRMLMSNMMPHVDKIKADDDSFIVDIIEYFRLLLEVVRSNTSGKTKHIMLLAATDTMGGYMKHLVLPVTKYAYYAGNIQYASIIRLYQLYDELKNFLRTNGEGWSKPWKNAGKHIQAKSISVQAPSPTSDPCKGIIYYKHGSSAVLSSQTKTPRGGGGTQAELKQVCGMDVPLPFFDSKTHPSAIAVPFRTFGLRNVESRVSAYILVKYFVAVSKCMAARNTNDEDVRKFNANIFSFIVSKVMPHLGDDRFYAAFGGVLRILQTVQETTKSKGNTLGNINIMPETQDREPSDMMDDEDIAVSKTKSSDKRSKNNLILLAALATIIIWFCLGAAFVCCRIKAGRMRADKALRDDENACRETTCPALYQHPSSQSGTDNDTRDTRDTRDTKIIYSVKQKSMQAKPSKVSSKASRKSSKTSKSTKSTKSTPSRKTNTTEMDSHSDSRSLSRSRSQSLTQTQQRPISYSLPQNTTTSSGNYRPNSRPPSPVASRSGLQQPQQQQQPRRVSPVRQPPPRSSESHFPSNRPATATSKASKPPQIQVHSVQYYPPTFACHTSMTGKVKLDSSTDDYTSDAKRPYVFGYDFQTTSEDSSPRAEQTSDGENEMGGNMSK